MTDYKEVHDYYVSLLLPNSPDRRSLVEQILHDLKKLPSPVEILPPRSLIERNIESYIEGTPRSGKILRIMSLDLRVALAGNRRAVLSLEEVTDEVVMLNFAFNHSTVRPPSWNLEEHRVNPGDTRHFMHFLLALNKVYPCLVGTLALDLLASDILCLDNGETFLLADGMSFEQLASPLLVPGADYQYDFAIINPGASGADKPLIHSLIGKPVPDGETEGRYHDLEILADISGNVAQAEKFYDRMYESRSPRDDRGYALFFLSKAIGLATGIGLGKEAARLKKRSEHIDAVFNAQFRF